MCTNKFKKQTFKTGSKDPNLTCQEEFKTVIKLIIAVNSRKKQLV